mmetsp:Transcript_67401/g.82601  ORF Transcript_67401/g.82601 Transcript_67401/m.82601 type:complete len:269 (-) Transcript_67401:83-889(-)
MAMEDCCLGLEIRRTWSEQELVRSFGGQMPPGTPDGMFETWDGTLTCVQVVRVPLVRGADDASLQHTLTQTILCKIVKSQTWLRYSSVSPHEFIIFCWLPFAMADSVRTHVETLMSRVRLLDHRFSARLRLPAEPGSIFPALFACNYDLSTRSRSLSESDVSTFVDCEGCADEEETCDWDITWDWAEAEPTELAEPAEPAEPVPETCIHHVQVREEKMEKMEKDSTFSTSRFSPPSSSSVPQRFVCDVRSCIVNQFQCELHLPWDDKG